MIDFTGNYHSGGAVILPAFYVTEIRAYTCLYLYIKQTKTESANKASLQISQCSQYNFD